ncbi:MAG: hypothetical protein J6R31_06750, partial [Rikenellaceae bacterium]|nr:hypothetical protein [Rikenellaceae bacterium]
MKRLITLLFCTIACVLSASAQPANPVKWSTRIEKQNDTLYNLVLDARIDRSWHIYDFGPYDCGINPTVISVTPSEGFAVVGEVTSNKPATKTYDKTFDANIGYWEGSVRFVQAVRPYNNVDIDV